MLETIDINDPQTFIGSRIGRNQTMRSMENECQDRGMHLILNNIQFFKRNRPSG